LDILSAGSEHEDANEQSEKAMSVQETVEGPGSEPVADHANPWQTMARVNLFRRKAQDPPPEVSAHTVKPPEPMNAHGPANKWDIRARFEDFAATQAEKIREKKRPTVNVGTLPVTVIPAPPRRRDLTATLEELQHSESGERPLTGSSNTWVATPSTLANQQQVPDANDHSRSPQRLSDPYTPTDLNGHSIHQRGAISFATPEPQDAERSVAMSPVSPISAIDRDTPTAISSRGSPSQPRSPVSPRRDGLPFMSIPAPPRRPRSTEE